MGFKDTEEEESAWLGDQLNIRVGQGARVKAAFQVVHLDNWVDDSSFPNARGTDLLRVNNECLCVCGDEVSVGHPTCN